MQEAQGHIESGAAPHLEGCRVAQDVCSGWASLQDVVCADAGCQQALVCITPAPLESLVRYI